MALDILAQDIIIDETTDLQNDDVNPLDPQHNNATVQHLLGLDDPSGGLTSPEVAFKTNFVVASASAGETITSVVLSQNLNGTPFSTTVGVNSGIRTVDGNYVWLFKDADPTHANVVIGVIGTSNPAIEPDEGGPLAFSFALISTSNTNADLYTVQYVPLFHLDPTLPDDRIDLASKVFASVTGTTTVSFTGQGAHPGSNEFNLLSSPDDASKQLLVTGLVRSSQLDPNSALVNSECNVSTQGFGVDNQSIQPDTDGQNQPLGREVLQIDFVTGGTPSAGGGADIAYGSHLENITQAGFIINQLTPSTPSKRADISISAFNVQGNEQGSEFFDGSPTNAVDITSLKLTGASGFASTITADGTYATASGNVTVTGLSGTGNKVTITGLDNVTTVDITTSGFMDRLHIESVDANEGIDITEVHFTTQSTNAYTEEVGSFINFDDDGPSIDPSAAVVPTLTVDETIFATNDSASFAGLFTSAFGNDGFKDADNNNVEDADAISYKLGISAPNVASGLVDTLTNEAVTLSVNLAGTVVTGSSATGGTVFTITLNADTGAVTLDQVGAVVHDDPLDPDESSSPAQLSAASLVTLTATITDGDLDTDTATRNIGDAFKFEDDGPSIDPSAAVVPTLTVDETIFATNDSASFAGLFTSAFGNDGFKDADNNNVEDADAISYKLGISAPNVASGLVDTLTNEAVTLSVNLAGTVVTGSSATGGTVFTITLNADTGAVTLDQVRAVVHDDPLDPDESSSPAQLSAASLVTLTATITDGDLDTDTATRNIGDAFKFEDDGPSIDPSAAVVPTLTVDETIFATNDSASFAGLFTSGAFGNDGFKDADNNNVEDADAISYKLGISAPNVASGLVDTLTNEAVTLSVNLAGTVVTGSSATGGTAFTITLNADTGAVTLDQIRAVGHPDPTDPDENSLPAQLSAASLVTLTATITDGDLDTDTATRNIGDAFKFEDDGPSITVPSSASTPATAAHLGNQTGQFVTGQFGYDIGADGKDYDGVDNIAGNADDESDFVDGTPGGLVNLALAGTTSGGGGTAIQSAVVTRVSEDGSDALFNFSFNYDSDPLTNGFQSKTATGTLAFDKDGAGADTFTVTMGTAIDAFGSTILHSSAALIRNPNTNSGHPNVVISKLAGDIAATTPADEDFYVQFTANNKPFSLTLNGQGTSNDTTYTFGGHDMTSSGNETWVSATQNTNGVASDTIKKGEALTLRFFDVDILTDANDQSAAQGLQQTERLQTTTGPLADQNYATADGFAIKFDGIGNSEDLMVILDLKDSVTGVNITRAVYIGNSDIFKTNAALAGTPYGGPGGFTLDNNDGLVVLEANDYNATGEHFEIIGVQIMQSSNGITGKAIDLNGLTGASNGSSVATADLVDWDSQAAAGGTDNDVIKITDLGFLQDTAGSQSAALDFSFAINDGDTDFTALQHIIVQVSNEFIV